MYVFRTRGLIFRKTLVISSGKGKGKLYPRTGHEGPEEYTYNSTLSLTSAPADLPLGKTQYPLYWRLGGPQGRSGRARKISSPPGFDPQMVQPVPSHYTDWAISAHKKCRYSIIYNVRESGPITGLDRPRGFQEVKVPRLHDNGTGWCYGYHPYAPVAFTPRKCSCYSFLLEAESTPGP
jgi:hypothetical protein